MELLLEFLLYPVGYLILRYGLLLDKGYIDKHDKAVELAGLVGWILIVFAAYLVYRIIH